MIFILILLQKVPYTDMYVMTSKQRLRPPKTKALTRFLDSFFLLLSPDFYRLKSHVAEVYKIDVNKTANSTTTFHGMGLAYPTTLCGKREFFVLLESELITRDWFGGKSDTVTPPFTFPPQPRGIVRDSPNKWLQAKD